MEIQQALNEIKKMANFFKAFEKLDETVRSVVECQQLIREITSRKTVLESECAALRGEKASLEQAVQALKGERDALVPKVEWLQKELIELKRKLS